MNEQMLIEYAPLIIIILTFILKEKIFVTPAQLAETKEEILREVKADFVAKEIVEEIKEDIKRIEEKLDNLIDYFMKS